MAVTRRSTWRIAEVLGLVVFVLIIGAWAWAKLRPDPYRPGTSHRLTLTVDPVGSPGRCANPHTVRLGKRLWDATSPGTRSHWSDWPFPLKGTLHIYSGGKATFTPDIGGSIPFTGGEFSFMPCSVD